MSVLLQARSLDVDAPGGRELFRGLNLSLERDAVALVGRNGVGKSTLLRVLAGEQEARRGNVARSESFRFVPQAICGDFGSPGESRRKRLLAAFDAEPDLLLLDEPTRDLDGDAIVWLRRKLAAWDRGLLVASHREAVLSLFTDFFVVEESGCHHFRGSFRALTAHLVKRREAEEDRYASRLRQLEASERRNETILRRRRRKKKLGRLHELARNPSRAQLGAKTSYAQESQGRSARVRRDRVAKERAKGEVFRRGLQVRLELSSLLPELPARAHPALRLRDVSLMRGGRSLFENISLEVTRERVAIVGANGAGKTSLFELALGEGRPTQGDAWCDRGRIGVIAQGAENWNHGEALISLLETEASDASRLAELLSAHGFPLALAGRCLSSLSPGERTRAALIALCHRPAPVEVLALDEPTSSLDLLAIDALSRNLRAWRGGLVVVSHDEEFLHNIGIDRWLRL